MEKLHSEEVHILYSSSSIKMTHLLGVGLTWSCSTNHKTRLSEEKRLFGTYKNRLVGNIKIYVKGIRYEYILMLQNISGL
jgi:hypothetical protein